MRLSYPYASCFWVAAFLVLGAADVSAQEVNDSLAKDLQEVTVEAESQKLTASSASYYPARKVRSASRDAIDLLQRSAINQIIINPVTKAVQTLAREDVTIFINYLKATKEDIEGLLCSDVRRIDYLDYPTDPRFQGAPHAINIVVQQYEYGGYTKLSDSQEFLNGSENNGFAASKFAYKSMTYDAYIGLRAYSSHHFASTNDSRFRLEEGTVTRREEMTSGNRNTLDHPVTLRATYGNGRNINIVNTIGFNYSDVSKQHTEGLLEIVRPGGTTKSEFARTYPTTDRSLSWNGAYYFNFPKSLNFYVLPSFAYTHSKSASTYSSTAPGMKPIETYAKDDAYATSISANLYKAFNNRNSIFLNAVWSYNSNNVDYTGTTEAYTDVRQNSYTASLSYTYNNSGKVYMQAGAGIAGYVAKTNGIKDDKSIPMLWLMASYTPTQKSSLQLSVTHLSSSPSAASRTVDVIRSNELMYMTGNPKINSYPMVRGNLSYTYFPNNTLTMQAFVNYFGAYDRYVNFYDLYDGGNAIITYQKNSGDFNRVTAGGNISLRLLSGNLVLQATPQFEHSESSGYYDISDNYFSWSASAQYYLGNFNFTAYYGSREHSMGVLTGHKIVNSSYYNIGAGWSKDAWNISLKASNFLRSRYINQWDYLSSPYYDNNSASELPSYRCSITVSTTYTFGYGKKIRRGNEVGAQGGASSAIMQ